MPNSEFCRVQAVAYLRLAESCDDPILAEELRALARQYSLEAERQERRGQSDNPLPPPRSE